MKILAVDDSKVIRKIIRLAVCSIGHEFLEAENGQEALEVLQQDDEIGLILLDWNMPVLDGYKLLMKLKQDESLKQIPVMMVTTESERKNVVKAIKAGAINYLTKPFSVQELIIKISECVGEKVNDL